MASVHLHFRGIGATKVSMASALKRHCTAVASSKIVVGRNIMFYEAKINHQYGHFPTSLPGSGKEAVELLFEREKEAEDKQAEEQAEEAPVAREA